MYGAMTHLHGREYLALIRRQRPEPRRPYTHDALGLTDDEYDELIIASSRFVGIVPGTASAPLLRLTAEWPTP